jgi:putative cardiolipin synthase
LRGSEFVRQLRNRDIHYFWGKGEIVSDHPDKVLTAPDKTETHLAPKFRAAVDSTYRELFLVSPYFIPGKRGVAILADVHRRGARVVVITNSLASTDGIPVHAKYSRYRKPLIEAGVELYEMKPTAGGAPGKSSEGSHGPSGLSTAGLHAKTFSFDRRAGFVGSYNLDPRSNLLNTEMGVLYDCPELAKRLPESVERDLAKNAYRIVENRGHIEWATLQDGREVRFRAEPGASFWKRLKVSVISWLPIEGLL